MKSLITTAQSTTGNHKVKLAGVNRVENLNALKTYSASATYYTNGVNEGYINTITIK